MLLNYNNNTFNLMGFYSTCVVVPTTPLELCACLICFYINIKT